MSGLRICMLTTFYPPFNFGGDGIGVQRLARALGRRGHEVTVAHDADAYNLLAPVPDPAPVDDPHVEVVTLRSGAPRLSPFLTQQLGRPVLTRGRIEALLRERDWDVIWYHNVSLVGGPGLLAMGSAVKIYEAHEHWLVCPSHVLWRHGREVCTGRECLRCVLSYRRPPQLWRYTGALTRQLPHVDAFIAKSAFSREKHHEFGFPRPMQVVPYFLPDRAGNETAEHGAPPHPRPYFLFVGRLEKIKGLDDVIPAVKERPVADLLIAGDGEYAGTLKQVAAGHPAIHFLGRIDPDRLRRYYQHALALIVPSVCFETFGIIIIEAFRQGTPVLARRIGPFPELIERAGAGAVFSDPAELIEQMQGLRDEPGRRAEWSTRALEAFDAHWAESAVVPRYLDVVAKAADARGRADIVERIAPGCTV